jgi:hypothetical protein
MNRLISVPVKWQWLLLWLFVAAGCKKNAESNLPEPTFEGKNTFGCLINGSCYIAAPFWDPSTGIQVPAIKGGFIKLGAADKYHIHIEPTKVLNGEVELFIKNEGSGRYPAPGRYELNQKSIPVAWAVPPDYPNMKSYGAYWLQTTDAAHTGWVNLQKVDTINNIISGRFEYAVYNTNDGKTYNITSGRFDMKGR